MTTNTRKRFRRKLSLLGASILLATTTACGGQSAGSEAEFPSETVEIVVPFGAGGGTDVNARAVATQLNESLDQSVIVQNIEGGGASLGLVQALEQSPDGHTLALVFPSVHATTQVTQNAPYDLNDLHYIGGFQERWYAIGTTAESGIETLDDLLELGQSQGELTAAAGPPSNYLATASQIADLAGVELQTIHHSAPPQAFAGMQAGDGDFWIGGDQTALELGDDINILAVAAPERLEILPEVPTLAELGYEDIHQDRISAGFAVHSDTPQEIIDQWIEIVEEVVTSDAMSEYAADANLEIQYIDPDDFEGVVAESLDVAREYQELLSN